MRFIPGLQARLALAFGAVAALAIAANLLAEHTVRVVVERASLQAVPRNEPPVIQAVAPVESVAPVTRPVRGAEYAAALEDHERAVQSRLASPDAAVQRQLASSEAGLARSLGRLQEDLGAAQRARRNALARDHAAVLGSARAAVARADERRAAQLRYAGEVDAVAALARRRLDGAWRVLGRVIARQQLIETRDRAEELRQLAVGFADPRNIDEGLLLEVARREAQLEQLVPAPRVVTQQEAATPEGQLRERLQSMRTARESLLALDAGIASAEMQRATELGAFLRRIAALPREVTVEPPEAAPRVAAAPPVAAAAAADAKTDVAPPGPGLESEPAAVTQTTTVDAGDSARAERARALLKWISAAVLVLMLLVSVLTVRGLMRQIARLLDGIRRVARGEAAAVPDGGLRELDVVAREFNAMSVQLAEARAENLGYQRDLETRVAERTSQLLFQAAHDPLTLLPNRRELGRLLELALIAARATDRRVGVFLVDLDNFKVVNDGMGHGFGDQVLVAMAQRLRELIPEGGFAARLGGDEFTVVAADADGVEAIRATGWALVRAFQQPLEVAGRELILSVSVGASVFPDHELTAESLLRAADSALFRAKALGRSQLAVFTPELLDAAEERFTTEQSLRRAIERGEFELVYQPEVDATTFEVLAVEALLRWRLPDGRFASPGEFLSIAEESGLIGEISDWVMREAVAAAGRWYRGGWTDVRVAINVSSRQLVDLGFVGQLGALLEAEGLPPTAVEIELTENVLQTGAHTVTTLHSLRSLGVATALDDFGTGYSSLASLQNLPLSRVKLDRSLIAAIDTSPRAAAIARSILGLCEGLGLAVTAEGVERMSQLDPLLRHQPLTLQGYLFARPMAEAQIAAARATMPGHVASLLLSSHDESIRVPSLAAPAEVAPAARTGYL